jgi:hypothetical protein
VLFFFLAPPEKRDADFPWDTAEMLQPRADDLNHLREIFLGDVQRLFRHLRL